MEDGSRHRAAIVVAVVPHVGPGVCAAGVWVEALLSKEDGCVPSSDDIDLSGRISPPPNSARPFPVLATM